MRYCPSGPLNFFLDRIGLPVIFWTSVKMLVVALGRFAHPRNVHARRHRGFLEDVERV